MSIKNLIIFVCVLFANSVAFAFTPKLEQFKLGLSWAFC
ncbi:Uncharacterised protein [Legionella birminghamensis]|uniref:Uncharacterized protein n=1 Tax=Legionella birminghamensis TaxID=28083 RepID=A0A378I9S9_9GAMM|nr:Uncharacterised protein [Legionella birminghamensis]